MSAPSQRPALPIPVKENEALRAARGAGRLAIRAATSPKRVPRRLRKGVDRRIKTDAGFRRRLMQLSSLDVTISERAAGVFPVFTGRAPRRVQRLAGRFIRAGLPGEAAQVYRRAARHSPPGPQRTTYEGLGWVLSLNEGEEPADASTLTTLLELADAAHARGDLATAADRLQNAFDIAFHRHFHFEDSPSPLSSAPERFLAPFLRSSTFAAVTSPIVAPRARRQPQSTERPLRVLALTVSNFNFLRDILDEYDSRSDVEVRAVDVRTVLDGPWRANPRDLVFNRLQLSAGMAMEVPEEVRADVDWADTIIVEWGHRAMTWVSLLPAVQARVVARLHSYEAFTQFPHITNWAAIDDLIFVSPHIRNLVTHIVPTLDASATRLHTIPNRSLLDSYDRPKRPGAERTLGMIGWGQVVKDPLWALDVLDLLREHDPSWRIRLIGAGFAPDARLTAAARRYRDRLMQRIDGLGDAVVVAGHTNDVGQALRRVGVVLSTSHREGTHEGLIQGAASGAVPVVRNWPYVAEWGGAHTMFPSEWVVDTPEEAAARILELVEEDRLTAAGHSARAEVQGRYDWDTVGPVLDEVLLGDRS